MTITEATVRKFMPKAVARALELLMTTKPPITESDLEYLLNSTIQREFLNLTKHGVRRVIEAAFDQLVEKNEACKLMADAAEAAYRRDHGGAVVSQEIASKWFCENCREEAEAMLLANDHRLGRAIVR